jgi:AraC-like DNA-binding protein
MHSDSARRWQVEDLASAVVMSRTTFTQRFKALVGLPPLSYLIRWRMAVAGNALRAGGKSLSAVAESVGYDSDTAFNSAFKRMTGRSPGRYRSENNERAQQQSDFL